jgi:hypothetical protein
VLAATLGLSDRRSGCAACLAYRPLVMAAVFLIVVAPNAWWLVENDFAVPYVRIAPRRRRAGTTTFCFR